MNILVICDRPNWAYHAIARALVKYNDSDDLQLEVFHLKGREKELKKLRKRYDGFFVLGWQLLEAARFLDRDRTLTGVHSHHSFDSRRTQPDVSVPPPRELIELLADYRGVNAVSRRLTDLFTAAGLADIAYTPNGVDTDLFRPTTDIASSEPLRVGFSGSKKHDWRKGMSEFIAPAADVAGLELRVAMPVEGNYVPQQEMPGFYNDIDVYVCASSSEGFSLSVLEAAASGRPIISTRVGGSEDLVEDGVNGYLVSRDVQAIHEKLVLSLEGHGRRLTQRPGRPRRQPVWVRSGSAGD